ncbi:MAG: hypothetical protein ABGW75_06750 [Pirellulales bacterium]
MSHAASLVRNGVTVHVKQSSKSERGLPVQEHKRLREELLRKIVVRERERQLLRKMSQ